MKTYLITHSEISQLADAICTLDWIKNRLPAESPEKADAAAKAVRAHALLEDLLGDDAHSIYCPAEPEETPA